MKKNKETTYTLLNLKTDSLYFMLTLAEVCRITNDYSLSGLQEILSGPDECLQCGDGDFLLAYDGKTDVLINAKNNIKNRISALKKEWAEACRAFNILKNKEGRIVIDKHGKKYVELY